MDLATPSLYYTTAANAVRTVYKYDFRRHFRILIKGVRNTHDTCLIVGNDGNCKGLVTYGAIACEKNITHTIIFRHLAA